MRAAFLLFAACVAAGCFTKSPISPSPGVQEFTLAAGQSATIPDSTLSLAFRRVSGDSRCPVDAVCIQGGSAQVEIAVVSAGGGSKDYVFETAGTKPVTHENLTITLLELSPFPFSSRTIEQSEYRAKLRVEQR
jgi:hypothetical protein